MHQNQHDDGHTTARAKFEFDDLPKAPSPTRAQPPRYIYRLDYEKRFPEARPLRLTVAPSVTKSPASGRGDPSPIAPEARR